MWFDLRSILVCNFILNIFSPCIPPRRLPIMSNKKTLSLWCFVMIVLKKLGDLHKKMILVRKQHFWAQKGHFGQSGPRNGPPSGQTATYRITEGIQSYLRIWGTYDPIESGPSDPKKWGFHRCSVKKCRFSGQKWAPAAGPRPAVQQGQHKMLSFTCPVINL